MYFCYRYNLIIPVLYYVETVITVNDISSKIDTGSNTLTVFFRIRYIFTVRFRSGIIHCL